MVGKAWLKFPRPWDILWGSLAFWKLLLTDVLPAYALSEGCEIWQLCLQQGSKSSYYFNLSVFLTTFFLIQIYLLSTQMYLYLFICIDLSVNVKRLLTSFVDTDLRSSLCLWQKGRLVQLQWELRLWFIPPHPLKLGSGTAWASQPLARGALGQIFHPTQQSFGCLPLLPCFWLFLQTAEQRMVLKMHCLQGFQHSSEFSSCLIFVCV